MKVLERLNQPVTRQLEGVEGAALPPALPGADLVYRGAEVVHPNPRAGNVEHQVWRKLHSAGRTDTVAGAMALALAKQLDNAMSPTGLSPLSTALLNAVETAMAGAERNDQLDELRAQRDRKFG